MIMLKSTHEKVVTELESKLIEKYSEVARLNSELAAANMTKKILEDRNTKLNVNITVAESKLSARENTIDELEEQIKEHKEYADELRKQKEQLEDVAHELHQDILDSGVTIKDLMDKIKSLEFCNQESNKEIKKLKTKLEVNVEFKRQLKDICLFKDKQGRCVKNENGKFLVNEKINGLKIWDLTVLLGE